MPSVTDIATSGHLDKQDHSQQALPLIILVDDEISILAALKRVLNNLDAKIISFTLPLEALEYALKHPPQLLICDQRMPAMSGTELMGELQQQGMQIPAILLSAYQDFAAVSQAFNAGCLAKFISKPWDNQELCFLVDKLLTSSQLNTLGTSKENKPSDRSTESKADGDVFHNMLSKDAVMHCVFKTISSAATASVPIFISGETGTGKELVAKACHQESYRHAQPFIAFNCANFSDGLMESQLFGHKKGAFTGANADQQGLFATAANGCLFLDEVTTLNAVLQAKLLRVIQEKEFTPLGSNKVLPFKATLITASSTTLRDAVAKGLFREDLFYRLNVISIQLPALRKRGQDALLLAEFFLSKFSVQHHKKGLSFTQKAISLINQYPWPGNIRQLENVIHNVVIMNSESLIDERMLSIPLAHYDLSVTELFDEKRPLAADKNPSAADQSTTDKKSLAATEIKLSAESALREQTNIQPLADIEKIAIEHAIAQCEGNVAKAAVLLEVSASTLYRKINSWQ